MPHNHIHMGKRAVIQHILLNLIQQHHDKCHCLPICVPSKHNALHIVRSIFNRTSYDISLSRGILFVLSRRKGIGTFYCVLRTVLHLPSIGSNEKDTIQSLPNQNSGKSQQFLQKGGALSTYPSSTHTHRVVVASLTRPALHIAFIR